LVVVDVETGREATIVTDAASDAPLSPQSPAWSPVDDSIAFVSAGGDLYVVAAEGGRQRLVVDGSSCPANFPAWSPDGRFLVFGRDCPGGGLHYVTSAGGEPRRLTRDRVDKFPDWSPTGDRVAFSRGLKSIYVTNLEGDVRQLTTVSDSYAPSWSPDSRVLLFTTNRRGKPEIWLMQSDGRAQRPVFPPSPAAFFPSWRR